MIDLRCGDCLDIINSIREEYDENDIIIVTDPPFNIGYKYNSYKEASFNILLENYHLLYIDLLFNWMIYINQFFLCHPCMVLKLLEY